MAELVPPVLPEAGAEMGAREDADWRGTENEEARLFVFLVTLAPVPQETALAAEAPLRTLDGVTREHIRDALLDAAAHAHLRLRSISGHFRSTLYEAMLWDTCPAPRRCRQGSRPHTGPYMEQKIGPLS